jgi:Protein of unknown function (DUF3486)
MVGLELPRSTLTEMKYPPSKPTQLPPRLRKAVENRLTAPGFNSYARLAQWIRREGCEVTVNSLRRYRVSLAKRLSSAPPRKGPKHKDGLSRTRPGRKNLKSAPPVNRQKTPTRLGLPAGVGDAGVTTEGLMLLTQEKLCSVLAEIGQLQQGDMSRLAHAVAHLTQAAVSFQRWTVELKRRAGEPGRSDSVARSALRKGLSPKTSEALRNALLGIAPFGDQRVTTQPTNSTENSADSLSPPANTGEAAQRETTGGKP